MLNKYPLWKYLMIAAILVIGVIYALPNLFGDDPALQISAAPTHQIDNALRDRVLAALKQEKISYKRLSMDPHNMLVRFADTETQLKAYSVVKPAAGRGYTVAMNLAPATPGWLNALNAEPMYLGLDLRGGVYFLMQVDMPAALNQTVESYVSELRSALRDERIHYLMIGDVKGKVEIKFRNAADRDKGHKLAADKYRELVLADENRDGAFYLTAALSKKKAQETEQFAIQQNITTLKNRVNELGVSEPVIQQQGTDRIVVQLPGVQDTAQAKNILGATATLEYHMVDTEHDVQAAVNGNVPLGSELFYDKNGRPVLLKKRVIITGDQITNASAGLDQQSGQPAVFVSLDGQGARRMSDTTRENVGKPMAVVYVETKSTSKMVNGKRVMTTHKEEKVISVATIRGHFSSRFQTTGLDSSEEAHNLALLLRAGALAAPMQIVEERTIGPSLGKDNIAQGFESTVIGFFLVLAFMAFWYRGFGMVANLALFFNLVLIVAVMSMLQATLTLPGIAGIVLTLGMAVDANVLIYERIREELAVGNSPHASIHAGYEKAFATIADSNVTTLLAAVVLFFFGTGAIKGFAVTLSIGIVTSMFTAIMGSRAVINLVVGGRRIKKLSI